MIQNYAITPAEASADYVVIASKSVEVGSRFIRAQVDADWFSSRPGSLTVQLRAANGAVLGTSSFTAFFSTSGNQSGVLTNTLENIAPTISPYVFPEKAMLTICGTAEVTTAGNIELIVTTTQQPDVLPSDVIMADADIVIS